MYSDSKFVVQFTTTGSKSWNIQAILALEMFHFYTAWKRQKTFGFLTFSGGVEFEHWARMDLMRLCLDGNLHKLY